MVSNSHYNDVPLKEYFDARLEAFAEALKLAREADQRAVDQAAEWVKERLNSHNDLLNKWRDATEKDRDNFVSKDAFDALRNSFDIYKEITAKALALAEGKAKGSDLVRQAIIFVTGVVMAGVAVYGAMKGIR